MAASLTPAHAISASTAPAGFVRTTVSGAESSSRFAASLIATPLLNTSVFSGRVGSARAASGGVDLIQPTAGNAAWTGSFDASTPHAVFVTSGSFSGFSFRVMANKAEGIVVDAQGFDLAQILTPGDAFEVRPLHTFKSLFGADAGVVPFSASNDAARADQLMISRDGTWRTYWFTGSVWRRTGASGDAGDDVILPQDGIVVYRRSSAAVQVRFVGEAPDTDAVISVPAGVVSTVANPFPTDSAIDAFGFESVSGWVCASQADQADQVQVCTGNAWQTFWHNGTSWQNSGSVPTSGGKIPAGTAMIVVRKVSTSANSFALITRPYDL